MSDFRLPDLGEGLTEATIVSWHVAVGDEVTLNQALAEVETAKALVELPSPRAGRIRALHAEEGETLAVGAPLVGFEEIGAPEAGTGEDDPADGHPADEAATAPSAAATPSDEAPAAMSSTGGGGADAPPARPERQQVLVGYGPVLPGTGRPRRRPRSFPTEPYTGRSEEEAARERPRAMPPVRRRARDLGVDLARVHGSGPGGRSAADVDPTRGPAPPPPHPGDRPARPRRAMTDSAFTAPHFRSRHVDVTDTLERLHHTDAAAGTSFPAAVCRRCPGRRPHPDQRHFDASAAIDVSRVVPDRGRHRARIDGRQPPELDTLDGPGLTARIAELAARAREGTPLPRMILTTV